MAAQLDEAFRRGGSGRVRSLRFGGAPRRSDWLRGDGWALSTEAGQDPLDGVSFVGRDRDARPNSRTALATGSTHDR